MIRPELLSPLSGLPSLDTDDELDFDDDDHILPPPAQPPKPIISLSRRGFSAHCLQRELAIMPQPGKSMLRFPVNGNTLNRNLNLTISNVVFWSF